MASFKKGNFVIKGAAGSVTMAGLATALVDSAGSAGWRDVTDLMVHNDACGKPCAITRDCVIQEITFQLRPGTGTAIASHAAVIGAISVSATVSIEKGDLFISTGFDMPELNIATGEAVIWEISGNQAEGQLGTIDVTVRKFLAADGTTAIDFATTDWAAV